MARGFRVHMSSRPAQRPALPQQPPSRGIYVWLATAPVVWGFNFVGYKEVFLIFTPMEFLAVRYVAMIACFWLVLWLTERDLRIERRDLGYFAVLSLVTVTIYQYLFAVSIHLTSVGESALLISSAPLWAALLCLILGWERFSARQIVGTVAGFVGIGLVIWAGSGLDYVPDTHLLGDALMLLSAVLWGAYAVFAKPLLARYSPMKVLAVNHTLGGVVLIALGAQAFGYEWANLSASTWFWLLYLCFVTGVYGFFVWYRGVKAVGPARTMLFQYFVPVVALASAIVLRDEWPNWLQLVGVALTLAGVHAATTRPTAAGPAGIATVSNK